MFGWIDTQTSLNLSNFPLATAQVPPGVKSGWEASFLLFYSGLVVRCSQHTSPPVVVVVLRPSPITPPPPSGLHVLPDPACGKVCLCPRSLPFFSLSRLFPPSSYFCLLSAFISLSPRAERWVGGWLGGLSCLNNTNRSLRNEERGGRGRRRRSRQAGVRKKKDTKRPKIGGLTEQIKKKSDS